MTAIRWILWLTVGGITIYVLERLLGDSTAPGILSPGQLMDPSSQVGQRGTGASWDAREDSWRTLFTSPESRIQQVDDWRDQFVQPEPGIELTVQTDNNDYVNVGDPCSPTGSTAVALINGQNEQVECRRTGLSSVPRWYWWG